MFTSQGILVLFRMRIMRTVIKHLCLAFQFKKHCAPLSNIAANLTIHKSDLAPLSQKLTSQSVLRKHLVVVCSLSCLLTRQSPKYIVYFISNVHNFHVLQGQIIELYLLYFNILFSFIPLSPWVSLYFSVLSFLMIFPFHFSWPFGARKRKWMRGSVVCVLFCFPTSGRIWMKVAFNTYFLVWIQVFLYCSCFLCILLYSLNSVMLVNPQALPSFLYRRSY